VRSAKNAKNSLMRGNRNGATSETGRANEKSALRRIDQSANQQNNARYYFTLLRAFWERIDLRRPSRFFFTCAAFAGEFTPNGSIAGAALMGFASLIRWVVVVNRVLTIQGQAAEVPLVRGGKSRVLRALDNLPLWVFHTHGVLRRASRNRCTNYCDMPRRSCTYKIGRDGNLQ
jgi:hypothetical protein